ncbi:hypothetical protein, partial [Akkermansia muciniphila]|uniref:hypothetical protein n=1 Tax=Akkermansia muciniphila TaxID=239935 RepID=UPI0021C660B1
MKIPYSLLRRHNAAASPSRDNPAAPGSGTWNRRHVLDAQLCFSRSVKERLTKIRLELYHEAS